jgi:hypothetical protein
MNFNNDSNIDLVTVLTQLSKFIETHLFIEKASNKLAMNVTLILLFEKFKFFNSVDAKKKKSNTLKYQCVKLTGTYI